MAAKTFDPGAFCIVYCQHDSEVVQMHNNIFSKEKAEDMAEAIRLSGGYVFKVLRAGQLIASLELREDV